MKESRCLKAIVILGVICLSLISCKTVRWVRIDRLTPSKLEIPESVRRVAVVGSRQSSEVLAKKVGGMLYLDTETTADTLAQYLADAAYFDEVVRIDSVLSADMFMNPSGHDLKPTVVESICRESHTDMLLVIDEVSFLPREVNIPFARGKAGMRVTCYRAGGLWPIAVIEDNFELDWDEWEVLKVQVACLAATAVLPYLVPQWQFEDLPFYAGANFGQREAAVFVREDNWEGAASMWRQQLKHKNISRRMEAHLNMAVYHEIKDSGIDTARVYAEKALELSIEGEKTSKGEPVNPTYDYLLISDYLENLERRGADLKRVNEQMQRFLDVF